MGTVWIVQHLDAEPPARIADGLQRLGWTLKTLRPDREPLPSRPAPECAALVVMGGPMAVYDADRHPWIAPELTLLRAAMERGLPILGVCLGAQLLAAAAGAAVYPGGRPKEIGWGQVTLTPAGLADPLTRHLSPGGSGPDAATCTVFQWHGDTFDLPPGAALLAGSAPYPHQAFRLGGNVYGIQFHCEVTEPIVRDWVTRWGDDVADAGLGPEPILADCARHLPGLNRRGDALIAAFGGLPARAEPRPVPVTPA
jgi:GMP synthase (glutamine-hydrolysing)